MPELEKETPVAGEMKKDEKTMGMLCHLLGLIGFVGPLIIWLIKKDEMPFVDQSGKESLNFQLTVLIAWMAMSAIAAVTCGLGAFLAPFILIADVIFCVMAAMKANDGVAYRYPVTIRFIK
jgi:uncharacterized protein